MEEKKQKSSTQIQIKRKTFGSNFLLLLAFISGVSVMAIELAASRLLAPFFGSSLFVWTNIIGLIMFFLAIGYFLGGRISDSRPDIQLLLKIIFFAGVVTFFIPFLIKPIASVATIESFVDSASLTLLFGSFFTTVLLFILPVTLLGMVSPFIIRLFAKEKESLGTKSGLVFALSTLGSIVGTFLSALVLIPFVGTKNTVFLVSFLLSFFTLPFIFKKKWLSLIIIPPIIVYGFVWTYLDKSQKNGNQILKDESAYHYIQIIKEDQYDHLLLEDGRAIVSFYQPNLKFSNSFYDYFDILPYANERKNKEVLIIGLAGGTIVHQYNNLLGDEFNFQIDGVEIDKKLILIARKYFDLKYNNLKVYNTDGRIFLKQNDKKYDIIIIDAFSKQLYIPSYLTTKEFFKELRPHLNRNGILALNVAAVPGSKLHSAITNTLASEFEYVYTVQAEKSYNFLVLAGSNQVSFLNIHDKIKNAKLKKMAYFIKSNARQVSFDSNSLVLKDDRAPTEFLTDKMAFEYFYQ